MHCITFVAPPVGNDAFVHAFRSSFSRQQPADRLLNARGPRSSRHGDGLCIVCVADHSNAWRMAVAAQPATMSAANRRAHLKTALSCRWLVSISYRFSYYDDIAEKCHVQGKWRTARGKRFAHVPVGAYALVRRCLLTSV